MAKINLYIAHSLSAADSCADLAQHLAAQLEMVDQYDTVNRSRVENAKAILADPQRRAIYDSLLADQAAQIDEQVLVSIASATPTPPANFVPTPGSYPPAQAQHPQTYPQTRQSPHSPQTLQQRISQVVVVPDGLMPKAEYWADTWTIETSPDGSAIRLIGTGKGAVAKKAAKKTGDDKWEWVAVGIGALFGVNP